jgi:hypothetical protein
MEEIFDKNSVRLQLRRDQAEEQLIVNRQAFEDKLKKYIDEIGKYKTKDSPFLNKEEMRVNSENLRRIDDQLQKCMEEADVNRKNQEMSTWTPF